MKIFPLLHVKEASASRLVQLLACAALTLVLSLSASAQPAQTQSLVVESTPQQPVKGWGAFVSYHQKRIWGPSWSLVGQTDALQNKLLIDSGLTLIRVNLEDGYYDPAQPNLLALNDVNGQPNGKMQDLIEHLQLAKTKGINDFIMSVWTPPAIFKTDGLRGGYTELLPEFEDAFVTYATNAIVYLRSRNDLPRMKAFAFQNEPGFAAPYGGTIYQFEQYNRVGQKFAAAFAARGINDVILMGGEAENPNNLASLLIDPATPNAAPLSWAQAVSMHSYDNALWNSQQRAVDIEAVAAITANWGRELWMTEWDMLHYGNWQWQSHLINTSAWNKENTAATPIAGWTVTGMTNAVFTELNPAVDKKPRARRLVQSATSAFTVSARHSAMLLTNNWYRVNLNVRGGAALTGDNGSWLELTGYDVNNPNAITRVVLSGADSALRSVTSPDIQVSSGTITITILTQGAANERLSVDDIVLYGHSETWASDLPYREPSAMQGAGPHLAITNDMDRALTYARHFTRDMSELPFSYWFSWIMWTQDGDRKLQTHVMGPSDNFTLARSFTMLSKIFKTVKPDAGFRVKRMRYANTPSAQDAPNQLRDKHWSELDMVAFESPVKTVILLTNRFPTEKSFNISGVARIGPSNTARVFRMTEATSAADGMVDSGTISVNSGSLNINLPPRSITLIETSAVSTPGNNAGARPAEGTLIAFKAKTSNQFVCAEDAGNASLVANRTTPSVWEQFQVSLNAAGDVSLRAGANNRYVCAENSGEGPLIANRDTATGTCQRFEWVDQGDGSFALRSNANAQFVQVQSNGELRATGTTPGATGVFVRQ